MDPTIPNLPPPPPHPVHAHLPHPELPPGGSHWILRDSYGGLAEQARELQILRSRVWLTVWNSAVGLAAGTYCGYTVPIFHFAEKLQAKGCGDMLFLLLLGWWMAAIFVVFVTAIASFFTMLHTSLAAGIVRLLKREKLTTPEWRIPGWSTCAGVILGGIGWVIHGWLYE